MLLKFKLDKDGFRFTNPADLIAARSIDYIKCHFDIEDSTWANTDAIVAVFKSATYNKHAETLLDSNNSCFIDPSVYKNGGTIQVKLIGDKYQNEEVISSTTVTSILEFTINENVILPVTTPSMYAIVIAELEKSKAAVDQVLTDIAYKLAHGELTGVGIQDVVYNLDGTVTVTLTDSTTFTSSFSLKGEKGDSGVYYGSEEPTDPEIDVWVDPNGESSMEPIYPLIEQWLDDHPEATTTVQDKSITDEKLSDPLLTKVNQINDFATRIVSAEADIDALESSNINLSGRLSTAEDDIDLLDSRVDQIVAPSGEAPNPAEIIDARICDDGITYPTLGDAIRTQFSDVKSDISEVTNEEPPINLIDPTTIVDNSIWRYTNPESGNYSRTGYIKVKPETAYTFANTEYQYWSYNYVKAKFIAYFDADKARISTDEDKASFTTPSGCEYVAITFRLNARAVILIEGTYDASTQTMVYVPYVADKRVLDGATVSDLSISNIDDYAVPSKNLFDVSKSTANAFLEKYPSVEANNNSFVSDYIPVKANVSYVISNDYIEGTYDYSCRSYVLYDNQYQKVSADKSDVKSKVVTPTVDGYMRFCGYSEQKYRTQVEVGETPTAFEPYRDVLNSSALLNNSQLEQVRNVLYGKKWIVCGDSFTNGNSDISKYTSGKYVGRHKVYPYIIGAKNNMDVVKFFEGGRTLAFPAEPGTFTNSITNPTRDYYYQNIPADADYITFYLGINDEHHATGGGDGEDPTGVIPLGAITDNTTASYYGAWNVVLTWLITNRPNAHIGIIVTNGLSLESYRTAQIEIARKYGIPFIDMNGDDRTPAMLRTVNPNIPSAIKQALVQKWAIDPSTNTHPNEDAHEYESTYIENFLRSI